MNNQNANIIEGTISFWIDKGKIKFNDNKAKPIIHLSPTNGSIFMVKDNDNKIKFFHILLGKGRTDIEYDVSNLDSNQKHMFAVTWSIPKKEIILYIDGNQVEKTVISY